MIAGHSLHIINSGSEPTFRSPQGSSCIDLTMVNDYATDMISNWNCSFDKSDSDHARLTYSVSLTPPVRTPFRDHKSCDWEAFNSSVAESLTARPFQFSVRSGPDYLNKINDFISNILVSAYDTACPLKFTSIRSSVPWWTSELTQARKSNRILHRRARRRNCPNLLTLYKEGLKSYTQLIKQAKSKGWRDHINKINSIPATARLSKLLRRGTSDPLGSLRKPDGSFSSTPLDTLMTLANALLPEDDPHHAASPPAEDNPSLVDLIVSPDRLYKALSSMPPNKTPGPDAIRTSMLTHCWETISPCILHLFKHSLKLGITPLKWQHADGVVISKPFKSDYTNPRAFRIISLTSTLQKLLEKLINWHIEHDLGLRDITTDNQHGFKRNFSTDSALHKLTSRIEHSLAAGNQALGLFLDIEGAFDNISFESIRNNLAQSSISPMVTNWICYMVSNRTISLSLNGVTITRRVSRGCPQGGVLSPLLWNITMNGLLSDPYLDKDFLQAFADDLAILLGGIDIPTIRAKCQRYLVAINRWCTSIGVKLSTLKSQAIMFTHKRKWFLDKPLRVNNSVIPLVTEVRYLGVVLDSKLSWRTHIEKASVKAKSALFALSSSCKKTWGLAPTYVRWIYCQVVLPSLLFGSVVWYYKLSNNKSLTSVLQGVQRSAALMICGAFSSSPLSTLEVIAGLRPIELAIKRQAVFTSLRLRITNQWKSAPPGHLLRSHARELDLFFISVIPPLNLTDLTPKSLGLDIRFSTRFLERASAIEDCQAFHTESTTVAYTDGSVKMA